jgi:hypothetical protein
MAEVVMNVTETPATVDKYILCLDTDKYAGNFERDATAYSTGIIGECEVGDDQAELFKVAGIPQDIVDELEGKIIAVPDEHGCSRPCEIQPTPGWVNDGMGTQYKQSLDTEPTPEQIDTWRKLERESKQDALDRAIHNKWSQDTIADYTKALAAVGTDAPHWYLAYNSVGIFLDEPLSDAALKVVIRRAKEYFTREGITLEGVRLVTEFSYTKSERIEWESLVS